MSAFTLVSLFRNVHIITLIKNKVLRGRKDGLMQSKEYTQSATVTFEEALLFEEQLEYIGNVLFNNNIHLKTKEIKYLNPKSCNIEHRFHELTSHYRAQTF